MSTPIQLPTSIAEFLDDLAAAFDPAAAGALNATYQFTFTGREPEKATITVRDQALQVERGHVGKPSLEITADSDAWLRFLAGDETPMGAIERLHGPLNLYVAFGRCFPAVVSEDDL